MSEVLTATDHVGGVCPHSRRTGSHTGVVRIGYVKD